MTKLWSSLKLRLNTSKMNTHYNPLRSYLSEISIRLIVWSIIQSKSLCFDNVDTRNDDFYSKLISDFDSFDQILYTYWLSVRVIASLLFLRYQLLLKVQKMVCKGTTNLTLSTHPVIRCFLYWTTVIDISVSLYWEKKLSKSLRISSFYLSWYINLKWQ